MQILPDCMLPDGAEPCAAYHELYDQYLTMQKQASDDTKRMDWLERDSTSICVFRHGVGYRIVKLTWLGDGTTDLRKEIDRALVLDDE